ncbi:MAG: hypothetical protein HQK52_12425 [Oligoflexia bacterium]|nr:hypothetical protein [Oligoflexia bacterium]
MNLAKNIMIMATLLVSSFGAYGEQRPEQKEILFSFNKNDYESNNVPAKIKEELLLTEGGLFQLKYHKIEELYARFTGAISNDSTNKFEDWPTLNDLAGNSSEEEEKAYFASHTLLYTNDYESNKEEIKADLIKSKVNKILEKTRVELHSETAKGIIKLVPPTGEKINLDTRAFPQTNKNESDINIVIFTEYSAKNDYLVLLSFMQYARESKVKSSLSYVILPSPNDEVLTTLAEHAYCFNFEKPNYFEHYNTSAMAIRSMFDAKDLVTRKSQAATWINDQMEDAEMASEKIKACVRGNKGKEMLSKARDLQKNAGVFSLPAYFVNGKRLPLNEANVITSYLLNLEEQILSSRR